MRGRRRDSVSRKCPFFRRANSTTAVVGHSSSTAAATASGKAVTATAATTVVHHLRASAARDRLHTQTAGTDADQSGRAHSSPSPPLRANLRRSLARLICVVVGYVTVPRTRHHTPTHPLFNVPDAEGVPLRVVTGGGSAASLIPRQRDHDRARYNNNVLIGIVFFLLFVGGYPLLNYP